MSILSETDFNALKQSGMLFEAIRDESFDGTYESYLKSMPKTVVDTLPGYFKVRVKNPEHSACLQKYLYSRGMKWCDGTSGTPFHVEKPYLFVEEGLISFGSTEEYFKEQAIEEYVFSDEE
ncbi:MAG: hypothetical protein KGI54_16390, partial [Pseudomonadota bacterium]|nr:hypothetical protein [Pseudomonadota bacterium]